MIVQKGNNVNINKFIYTDLIKYTEYIKKYNWLNSAIKNFRNSKIKKILKKVNLCTYCEFFKVRVLNVWLSQEKDMFEK